MCRKLVWEWDDTHDVGEWQFSSSFQMQNVTPMECCKCVEFADDLKREGTIDIIYQDADEKLYSKSYMNYSDLLVCYMQHNIRSVKFTVEYKGDVYLIDISFYDNDVEIWCTKHDSKSSIIGIVDICNTELLCKDTIENEE